MIKNIINNKIYIGQAHNIKDRWKQHISKLNTNKHSSQKLQNDFNRFGIKNFKFIVIEEIDKEYKLTVAEQYYIDKYDSFYNGYNMVNPIERNTLVLSVENTNLNYKLLEIIRLNSKTIKIIDECVYKNIEDNKTSPIFNQALLKSLLWFLNTDHNYEKKCLIWTGLNKGVYFDMHILDQDGCCITVMSCGSDLILRNNTSGTKQYSLYNEDKYYNKIFYNISNDL